MKRESGFASLPSEALAHEGEADLGFRTMMNAPMTLAGLARSLLKGKIPHPDIEGNIVSEAIPAGNQWGQTLGEVIFLHPELDPTTREEALAHEKEHVEQGGRMSVGYPILNLLETLQLALRGKDPYEENRFERAAREAEERFRKKRGYQAGSLSLADLPYLLRYGMGAEEKDIATAMGKAPGYEAPGEASADWPGARRSMSAFLGAQKWGEDLPQLAQQIRNAIKFWGSPGFRYSEKGEEAPGWDVRMDEVVDRAVKEATLRSLLNR